MSVRTVAGRGRGTIFFLEPFPSQSSGKKSPLFFFSSVPRIFLAVLPLCRDRRRSSKRKGRSLFSFFLCFFERENQISPKMAAQNLKSQPARASLRKATAPFWPSLYYSAIPYELTGVARDADDRREWRSEHRAWHSPPVRAGARGQKRAAFGNGGGGGAAYFRKRKVKVADHHAWPMRCTESKMGLSSSVLRENCAK